MRHAVRNLVKNTSVYDTTSRVPIHEPHNIKNSRPGAALRHQSSIFSIKPQFALKCTSKRISPMPSTRWRQPWNYYPKFAPNSD